MSEIVRTIEDYLKGEETCTFKYEWTIKNFNQSTIRETMTSPSFSSHYSDFDDEWIMKMYPRKATDLNDDSESDTHSLSSKFYDLSLDLELQSFQAFNDPLQLQVIFVISINNKLGAAIVKSLDTLLETISYPISSSELLKVSNEYDEFKINCTIQMSKKITNNSAVFSKFNATPQLSLDCKKLLLNKKSADVTIEVGQKSFRAIKGILGSPNIDKMPMELLAVAEKYQVDHLKNICEGDICETINFDNVASILVFSDRYNLEKLNKKCLEFMKKNLRAVMSNEKFQVKKKKYPELFVGVLEHLLLS
ncbi:speckle-type POZ protein-like [Aphidius gifuensis]|uniref:speckle-type POZ protein-like n=1 Tax=Aphidius gifuensis TaxID=684658 RepID=UPI001CDB7DE1|nr:speckle-type POZ protein-like [Aphidius gifuensis]